MKWLRYRYPLSTFYLAYLVIVCTILLVLTVIWHD